MGGGPSEEGMSSNEHEMFKIAFLDLPDRKGGEFPRKSKGGREHLAHGPSSDGTARFRKGGYEEEG